MNRSLSPICLFTYNRLEETKSTIGALQANFLAKDSVLHIFSDCWKNEASKQSVLEVRNYLKSVRGFKDVKIYENNYNKGLAKSIIEGVSIILKESDTIIVLEDDLITSQNFLDFMNSALNYYKNNEIIQSISGYSPLVETKDDYFLFNRPFPWGWATWREKWDYTFFDKAAIKELLLRKPYLLKSFSIQMGDDSKGMLISSLNNKISSWYILWTFGHFIKNTYCFYPTKSKVTNVGYSDIGTHCNVINSYVDNFSNDETRIFNFSTDIRIDKNILKYFSLKYKFIFRLKLLKTKDGILLLKKELLKKIYGK